MQLIQFLRLVLLMLFMCVIENKIFEENFAPAASGLDECTILSSTASAIFVRQFVDLYLMLFLI